MQAIYLRGTSIWIVEVLECNKDSCKIFRSEVGVPEVVDIIHLWRYDKEIYDYLVQLFNDDAEILRKIGKTTTKLTTFIRHIGEIERSLPYQEPWETEVDYEEEKDEARRFANARRDEYDEMCID